MQYNILFYRWWYAIFICLQTLRRTVENIKDPLYRFFEREVAAGASLLQQVLHDLRNVISICQVSSINKWLFNVWTKFIHTTFI